jgi:hypothetical protein
MSRVIKEGFISLIVYVSGFYDRLSDAYKEGVISIAITACGYYVVAPILAYLWQMAA